MRSLMKFWATEARHACHSSLQDWRKGRCAEVREVNGRVVDILKAKGKSAPMNQRVVDMALEIERAQRTADPANASELIATFKQLERAP
ncbi:MAG: ketopantoate reductase C-terminal domain-containing protein [Hyphomicrobiales bacterium]